MSAGHLMNLLILGEWKTVERCSRGIFIHGMISEKQTLGILHVKVIMVSTICICFERTQINVMVTSLKILKSQVMANVCFIRTAKACGENFNFSPFDSYLA